MAEEERGELNDETSLMSNSRGKPLARPSSSCSELAVLGAQDVGIRGYRADKMLENVSIQVVPLPPSRSFVRVRVPAFRHGHIKYIQFRMLREAFHTATKRLNQGQIRCIVSKSISTRTRLNFDPSQFSCLFLHLFLLLLLFLLRLQVV